LWGQKIIHVANVEFYSLSFATLLYCLFMKFTPSHPLMVCPAPLAEQPKLDLAAPADYSQRKDLVAHVESVLQASAHGFAWGGYLEQRKIYLESDHFFQAGSPRDIHLGIDIWTDAGSPVFAPLDGKIHSFEDNAGFCNYGPTLILEHHFGETFYTLYGHLSRSSIDGLQVGAWVKKGQPLCTLGAWEVNGNWPPHLHFQVIRDLEGWTGDYPGACTFEEKEKFAKNCPDPIGFLQTT